MRIVRNNQWSGDGRPTWFVRSRIVFGPYCYSRCAAVAAWLKTVWVTRGGRRGCVPVLLKRRGADDKP